MNNSAVRGFLKAVIIVGILFIVVYYFSYNKWLKHDFDSVDITYRIDNPEENKEQVSDKDNEKYQELYSNINYELLQYNFGEEFYDIYYNNKPFYDEYYLYVGIINIIKSDIIVNCNLEKEITGTELKNKIVSLFGNVNYVNKTFTTKNNKISITYDSDNDKYLVKLNGTCSGYDFTNGGIKNIYRKAETSGETLYIYDKSLYVVNVKDKNGNLSYNYYKGISKDSEVIADNFEKLDAGVLPTYIYKFVKENNQYTIKSIVKLS